MIGFSDSISLLNPNATKQVWSLDATAMIHDADTCRFVLMGKKESISSLPISPDCNLSSKVERVWFTQLAGSGLHCGSEEGHLQP